MLKADGEQSVILTGTVEMQQWCAGNWDIPPLVSVLSNNVHTLTVGYLWTKHVSFYMQGSVAYSNARFGSQSGPIWLDSLSCTGNENNLLNCSHSGIGITSFNCGHDDDVGVQCPGKDICVYITVLDIQLASSYYLDVTFMPITILHQPQPLLLSAAMMAIFVLWVDQ